MCAYDTTLIDTLNPPRGYAHLPAPARRRAARLESLLPGMRSAGFGLIMVLSGVFFITSVHRLNDTDLWGHLAFGRWIAEHHRLPTADPFIATQGDQRFVNVPWLTQLAGYLWYRAAGPGGLQLAHASLVTLAIGALIAAVRIRGLSLGWASAAGATAFLLSLPAVGTVRPQLLGLVGISLVLLALALVRTRRHPLVWLPLTFLLWANMHGSFAVGLAVLFLVVLGRVCDVWWRCGSLRAALGTPRVKRLWRLLLLCIAATVVNPAGPMLWWNVLLFGRVPSLADISEWRPTTLASFTGMLFFTTLLLTAILLRRSPRPVRATDILLTLVFAGATLSAIRMLSWWAMIWPFLAAPHAVAAWKVFRWHRASSPRYASPPSAMRTLLAMATIFLVLVWSPPTHEILSGRSRQLALVASADTPLYVADEIVELGLSGQVFAPTQWADYLAWRTHGALRPMVTSQVHLADAATWGDYRTLATATPQSLEVLERRGVSYLVVPRELAAHLAGQAGLGERLRTLYQDQQAMLLEFLPPAAMPTAAIP